MCVRLLLMRTRGRLCEHVIDVNGLRARRVANGASASARRSRLFVRLRAGARELLTDLNVVRRLNGSRLAASPGGRAVEHAVLGPLGYRFAGVGWSTRF
jgi:hypothetical protein